MSSMAIALAVKPECLFILSPTSGLTAYARENYAPLLQTISKDKSFVVILNIFLVMNNSILDIIVDVLE